MTALKGGCLGDGLEVADVYVTAAQLVAVTGIFDRTSDLVSGVVGRAGIWGIDVDDQSVLRHWL